MAEPFSMSLDGDLMAHLDQLDVGIQQQVLRSAAHAGAKFLQDVAKAYAPIYVPEGLTKRKITPGQLRDSIYRVFSDSQSSGTFKLYEISWNHTKAPHGYWMENGFWLTKGKRRSRQQVRVRWVPGKAFIRLAGERSDEALRISKQRAEERLQELLQSMQTGNAMKGDPEL